MSGAKRIPLLSAVAAFVPHQDFAHDLAIQEDGRILLVGAGTLSLNDYDFALARYLGT